MQEDKQDRDTQRERNAEIYHFLRKKYPDKIMSVEFTQDRTWAVKWHDSKLPQGFKEEFAVDEKGCFTYEQYKDVFHRDGLPKDQRPVTPAKDKKIGEMSEFFEQKYHQKPSLIEIYQNGVFFFIQWPSSVPEGFKKDFKVQNNESNFLMSEYEGLCEEQIKEKYRTSSSSSSRRCNMQSAITQNTVARSNTTLRTNTPSNKPQSINTISRSTFNCGVWLKVLLGALAAGGAVVLYLIHMPVASVVGAGLVAVGFFAWSCVDYSSRPGEGYRTSVVKRSR